MPIPSVPWGSRDTSALSHEQIHRWVHDGADPGALEGARQQHAAHGEELRVAARRLEAAHAELSASWQGRDADAATAHIRTLAARMTGLGDAVSGQAGSIAGVRDALARVQAAVGPPRAPALPVLAAPPGPAAVPTAVTPGGQDGFAAFQMAQEDERAAQEAYRVYLEETSAAARAAPSALAAGPVGAPPVPPPAGAPSRSVPGTRPSAVGGASGPDASGRGAPAGALARAAAAPRPGAVPPVGAPRAGHEPGRAGGPPGRTTPTAGEPAATSPGSGHTERQTGPTGAGRPPGLLGRLATRLAGGTPRGAAHDGVSGAGGGGTPGASGGVPRRGGRGRSGRSRPGRPAERTPADRLHEHNQTSADRRHTHHDEPHHRPARDARPGHDGPHRREAPQAAPHGSRDGGPPVSDATTHRSGPPPRHPTPDHLPAHDQPRGHPEPPDPAPGARTGVAASLPSNLAPNPPTGGPGAAPQAAANPGASPPGSTPWDAAAALTPPIGPLGTTTDGDRIPAGPGAPRHPEYLVELDPVVADPDDPAGDGARVTPPVLGAVRDEHSGPVSEHRRREQLRPDARPPAEGSS